MSEKGWSAEFFYEGDEVLMAIIEIEGLATLFRMDNRWNRSMPDDMDLSDAEVVSVKAEDVKPFMDKYDNNDSSLLDDLKAYPQEEEEE